jgi:cell shape-determining protein MreC
MPKYFILTTAILSCILLILLAGWCVSDSKGSQLSVEKETLTTNLSQLNSTVQTQEQQNESMLQTLSDLTDNNHQLQSKIDSLQSQLDLEKNKNKGLSQQLGQSQESFASYQSRVAGVREDMVKDYNDYLINHSGSPTNDNIGSSPVLSSSDRGVLNAWYTDVGKFKELTAN